MSKTAFPAQQLVDDPSCYESAIFRPLPACAIALDSSILSTKVSLRLARQLVSDARFLRVNTVTAPGSYSLDGPREIGELADLGNRAALQTDVLGQVKSRFLNGVSVTPWEQYS